MFFITLSGSPLWTGRDDFDKNVRALILGLILYVLFYIYLNSSIVPQSEVILKYKKYYYGLFFVDLIYMITKFYKDACRGGEEEESTGEGRELRKENPVGEEEIKVKNEDLDDIPVYESSEKN